MFVSSISPLKDNFIHLCYHFIIIWVADKNESENFKLSKVA